MTRRIPASTMRRIARTPTPRSALAPLSTLSPASARARWTACRAVRDCAGSSRARLTVWWLILDWKLVARYSGLKCRRRQCHIVYVRERGEHAAARVLAGRFCPWKCQNASVSDDGRHTRNSACPCRSRGRRGAPRGASP